jgi:hypothetical protein
VRFDLDLNLPDGSHIEVRNTVSGMAEPLN